MPSLEIKQILLDSVSWIYHEGVEYLASGTDLHLALRSLKQSLDIYARNEIETTDMIILAYEKAAYSKIFEFMTFRDRYVEQVHNLQC